MAGRDRLNRASGTADEFLGLVSKVADAEGALALLRRLQAAIADKERLLEKEVARKADQREIRLKAAVGEAALRLIILGDEGEREWMREHLAPLLGEGDRREVLGETAWLAVRWTRRAAAEAARAEAGASRRKGSSSSEESRSDGASGEGGGAPGVGWLAAAPSFANGKRPFDPAGESDGTAGAGDALFAVAAVSFAEVPNADVRRAMKESGLFWSAPEQRWRPRRPGTVLIAAAQASAIRAAGGVIILEA